MNISISGRSSNIYGDYDVHMSDALEFLMSDIDPMNGNSRYLTSLQKKSTDVTSIHLPKEKVVNMSQLNELVMKVKRGEISALCLYHEPLHLLWADKFIDFNNPNIETNWTFSYYWDYICVEGKSFKPLDTNQNDIFQTVQFSLSN